MKTSLHVFSILLFWSGFANCAPLPLNVLKEKLQKYQNIESLRVDFTQKKTISDLDIEIKSSGTLTVDKKKDTVVTWLVQKPAWIEIMLNNSELLITKKEDGKKIINKISLQKIKNEGQENSNFFDSLLSWLDLDAEKLIRFYSISEKNNFEYVFTPLKPQGHPFESITLTLDTNGIAQKMSVIEKSKDQIEISLGTPKIKNK